MQKQELEKIMRFHRYIESILAGALLDKEQGEPPLCPMCGGRLHRGQYRMIKEGRRRYLNTAVCAKCCMEYVLEPIGKRKSRTGQS